MGSAALAGAAFVIGLAIGWIFRPRSTSRSESLAPASPPAVDDGQLRQVAAERERLLKERGEISEREEALKRRAGEIDARERQLASEREKLGREQKELTLIRQQAAAGKDASEAGREELVRGREELERDRAAVSREREELAREREEMKRAAAQAVVPTAQDRPPAQRVRAAQTAAEPHKTRERETTVVVCDVGSASPEDEVPANVLRCLTDLQKVLGGIVGDEGGTVDRFAGNRLIAVFIPKRRSADHAGRALEAAERIASNVGALSRRLRYDLRISIGIHSGVLPLDSDGHVDSSAIGDAIDVASRLEALAGEAKVAVVVTEAVLANAGRDEDEFDSLGEAPLGTGDSATRIFTPRPRSGAVQLTLIDPKALGA